MNFIFSESTTTKDPPLDVTPTSDMKLLLNDKVASLGPPISQSPLKTGDISPQESIDKVMKWYTSDKPLPGGYLNVIELYIIDLIDLTIDTLPSVNKLTFKSRDVIIVVCAPYALFY